jgi:transcriptional regulator with XRE-family HTH domain
LPDIGVSAAVYTGTLWSGRCNSRRDIDPVIFLKFLLTLTIPRVYDQQNGYPESPKTIGEHIRKRRPDLKLLQSDVVGIIGVSECTIFCWEKGLRESSTKCIPRIIDFLGYTPFECPGDILGRLSYFKRIKGLTFRELGELMGRDHRQLADWLSSHKTPGCRNLESMNQFLVKHSLHVVEVQKS